MLILPAMNLIWSQSEIPIRFFFFEATLYKLTLNLGVENTSMNS